MPSFPIQPVLKPSRQRQRGLVAASILLIVFSAIPEAFLPARAVLFRDVLKRNGLNRADYESNEQGYYQALLETNRHFGNLDGSTSNAVATHQKISVTRGGAFDQSPLVIPVADIREFILKPNVNTKAHEANWVTNSLGLCDSEYAYIKPENTLRIALLGDSIASGWGVNPQERFEELWEKQLNKKARQVGNSVEIWNFAVPGHAPGQRWRHFTKVGQNHTFDLAVYEATTSDPGWDARRLGHLLARGIGTDDPLYAEVLKRAEIRPSASPDENLRSLLPLSWTILQSVYESIVTECHQQGMPVAYVLIPRVGSNLTRAEIAALLARARSAGFDIVVDLSRTYDGYQPEELAIAPRDYHPNTTGHAMLAEGFERELHSWPALQDRMKTPRTAP